MNDNYNILISKLDEFIRRFYKNLIIKGSLLSATIVVTAFITLVLFEYIGEFSILVRTILFYFFITLFVLVGIKFILLPILSFFKIGSQISHQQASNIISNHFPVVKDKLINILELVDNTTENVASKELIIASVNQKIDLLKPISFKSAINIRQNLKYLKYLAPVLLVVFTLFIYNPSIITEGSGRIINHSTYFKPKLPYEIIVKNDSLNIEKGSDLKLNIEITGVVIPKDVYINFDGNKFLLDKETNTNLSFDFKNINNNIDFTLSTEEYTTNNYSINVLPTPYLQRINITVDVPDYTLLDDIIIDNIGDISVPIGSNVKWEILAQNVDSLSFIISDSHKSSQKKDDKFIVTDRLLESSTYSISINNQFFKKTDIINHSISVIPDLYPEIAIDVIKDSLLNNTFYYRGFINDDYGLSKLTFNFIVDNDLNTILIPINANIKAQEFFYAYEFNSSSDKGTNTEYYFEIWDNDKVNGNKSTKSQILTYYIPSKEELKEISNEIFDQVKDDISKSKELLSEIMDDIKNLQSDLINKDLTAWEQKEIIKEITDKQKALEKLLEKVANENNEKNKIEDEISKQDQELLDKKQQIEDLLKKLMNDELKELLDEFNKLKEEFDQEKLNELSEDMEMSLDELSEQLDNSLEQLKQLEVEQDLKEIIDELQELSDKQEEISEQSKEKDKSQNELTQEQQKHAEKFDELKEKYKETEKLNQELNKPKNLENYDQEFQDIQEEFKTGEGSLQKGKMNKASKSQKSNSKKLENMSKDMQSMMQSNQMQQDQADMEQLRQIIDNILKFSFTQERILTDFKSVKPRNPLYIKLVNDQNKINDDFEIIKDSLNSLAETVPMISSTIYDELYSIRKNINTSLENLDERKTSYATKSQQYVMTSANNLALLLSEVLEQMQQQNAKQMEGDQQCQKPGQGKPSMSQMKSQQEDMKSQLEQMIKQMKDGKLGKNGMNKKLGKMLSQQEMFNQKLNEISQNSTLSPKSQKLLNEVKKLSQQNESDLINKNITPNIINRQDQILTRLLEAEKSELEREKENKRESKQPKNKKLSNPNEVFKYKRIDSKFDESIKEQNIYLNSYFKNKYKKYLININRK